MPNSSSNTIITILPPCGNLLESRKFRHVNSQALSTSFKYNISGENISLVVTDVNRKIAFRFSYKQIGDLGENLDSFDGEASIELFWDSVEKGSACKLSKLANLVNFNPSSLYWAQFVNSVQKIHHFF